MRDVMPAPVQMAPRKEWKWSLRTYELLGALDLPVVYDTKFPYERGSNPDRQTYRPKGVLWDRAHLRIDPGRTSEDDLLHEIGHHLECVERRPDQLAYSNWGMDDLAKTHSDNTEPLENLACDLEVGLRVLWGWKWHDRARLLNLPDWWKVGWTWAEEGRRLKAMVESSLKAAL